MYISKFIRTALLALVATSFVLIPLANAAQSERGNKRGGPPQEAFDACANKAEGDACTFSGPRGDAQGTCLKPPHGEEVLACAPERGQREPRSDRDSA